MLTEPTPEMLAALQSFADRNGRLWKSTLSTLWGNGRDYYEPEGTELHAVRNELGPTWLYDKCQIKPVQKDPLYCIIADGEFDQVCSTKKIAEKEKRDLEKLGCSVRIRKVADWDAANALEEKMRGY